VWFSNERGWASQTVSKILKGRNDSPSKKVGEIVVYELKKTSKEVNAPFFRVGETGTGRAGVAASNVKQQPQTV